jgi:hypothetical protein
MTPPERNRQATRARSPEIDVFLAALPDDVRKALENPHRAIAAAAPDAVETISYGVPAFKYRGRPLVPSAPGGRPRVPARFTSRVRP